ncbi:RTA1 like protein-domain-containing protein [Fomitopsis betulina]|nr:RTA1 like protein-domain-containing protein [Fomitopsis betulina]
MVADDRAAHLIARVDINPYGYVPTEWICILFIVLFFISTLVHAGQAVKYRLWWLLLTPCLAGILEVVGWIGRAWSSQSPYEKTPYLIQIICTIIGPTPFVAANFIILGQLIRLLGPCYSRLTPKWYTLIFCGCDVISLVIQALGGAIAARAVAQSTSPKNGGHIMLAGIVFQMASITFYMIFATEFIIHYLLDRPLHKSEQRRARGELTKKTKLMLMGLVFSSILIYIRSIYRTIELADGFRGYIMSIERYFDWLDGGMVTLAMFSMNFLHPGQLLGPASAWKNAGPGEASAHELKSVDTFKGYNNEV